jgi:hypothetical protein
MIAFILVFLYVWKTFFILGKKLRYVWRNLAIFGKNYVMSGKILLFSEKLKICLENFFCIFAKINMSGNFFELTSPPPHANISRKIFFGALFFQKVPLETGAPSTFLCFQRP